MSLLKTRTVRFLTSFNKLIMLSKKLSQKKRKFIEFLKTINLNKPKPAEIAKDIGISLSTYYRWLKDKELFKIVEQENALQIDERLPEVLETLVKKAIQGDVRAIKIFLDRYDDNKDIKNIADRLTPDKIITIIRMAKKESKEKHYED